MIKARHFSLIALLIVLLQSVLDNYLDFHHSIYILLTPIVVAMMPTHLRGIPMLLSAFFLGLVTDLLGNGILGLNASALTAMVLIRYPLIQRFTHENAMEKYPFPCIQSMGKGYFTIYLLLLYLVFMSLYILWESAGMVPVPWMIGRILVGTLINTGLGFLFFWLIIREQ